MKRVEVMFVTASFIVSVSSTLATKILPFLASSCAKIQAVAEREVKTDRNNVLHSFWGFCWQHDQSLVGIKIPTLGIALLTLDLVVLFHCL